MTPAWGMATGHSTTSSQSQTEATHNRSNNMATKDSGKKELEILLDGMELSTAFFGTGSCQRIVTVELVWPRLQVASKSAVKLYSFDKGKAKIASLPWVKRVLFKEGVERRFGIVVRVSETVTATAVRKFFRNMAGSLLGIAGDFAEDAIPSKYVGDAVAAPFDYAKKELKASVEAEIVAEGNLDLLASDLTASQSTIEIPLALTKNLYKTTKGHGPHDSGQKRQLKTPEGTVVGKASLQMLVLE